MDQAVVLRKLTGEQRVLQALSLSDFVRFLTKLGARKKSIKRTWTRKS